MASIDTATGNVEIVPLSDRALLVSFGNIIDPATNEKVLSLHQALSQSPFEGFVESVPAYASLAVFYDVPKIMKHDGSTVFNMVKNYIEQLLLKPAIFFTDTISVLKRIPVCYDPEFGPDIFEVASSLQLNIEEVITLHTSLIYRVYMIGFTAGFAYMGTVDERLLTRRKEQPRLNVPAGSVGIAGGQTGIYPINSPGGWQIIGKTPLRMFDTNKLSPCLLSAGDRVQFFSIDKKELESADGNKNY